MKRKLPYDYLDDFDDDSSVEMKKPSDTQATSNNNGGLGGQQMIVEKVLGSKYIYNEERKLEELYFIKWKGLSYLHASWERKDDIEQVDPAGKQKLKKFLLTPQLPGIIGLTPPELESGQEVPQFDDDDVEYFNPEMLEILRIVACSNPHCKHSQAKRPSDLYDENKELNETNKSDDNTKDVLYLVKWRGQSYDECSWERWEEIRSLAYREVWRFWKLQRPQPDANTPVSFPSLKDYKKISVSPTFGVSRLLGYNDDSTSTSGLEDTGLTLRDYQLEGVNWLLWNWWQKRPSILADEMGLGKTIQTVCFLHQLRFMSTTSVSGPFLIIAPLSLVDQWQSEIQTWSPDMNCILLHGNVQARNTIIEHEFYFKEPYVSKSEATALKKSNVCKFNILLTTFEVAVKEVNTLSKVSWQLMVIDEAHKLKNPTSKLFTTLSMINSHHCVLLTGTPLQNKTEELWALLNFADNKRFNDMEDFLTRFGSLKDASQVASLHDVLRPYLLRRIKEDVEKSLPPKEETIVEVALTSIQKKFYRAIYEKNTSFLFRGVKASNQPSLMNVMMELRKCCNHPYLVRGVEDRILSEIPLEDPDATTTNVTDVVTTSTPLVEGGVMNNDTSTSTAMVPSSTTATADQEGQVTTTTTTKVNNSSTTYNDMVYQKMIDSSGKLVLLDKLLPRLFQQGHKVLIFSQMVRVLNLLEDFMKYRGYLYERLDGSTKSSDRKEAVDRFCKPSMNRFIMLLSTKAGGLGLNLTAADTVIIYDSDWNPQNDLQAQARAHRIGQTKAVMVYRLLTRKTYEMQMFHQASMKLGLDRAVLAHARNEQDESNNTNNNSTTSNNKLGMDAKEIDELLKRGAYDVFREDDSEQKEFVEADIDSILQRRAHKITYDQSGKSTSTSSTLGSFSKASFVSADEKEDVDINDPDFWRKAVGLDENVKSILEDPDNDDMALLPSQRVRKQTKVYGPGPLINDDLLDQLLKPVKGSASVNSSVIGGGGSVSSEVVILSKEDKKQLKALQKEAAKKERQEKDELRRLKIAEENRLKHDPMHWGSHTRDRVLRSLQLYGFGRWERIKGEIGKEMMESSDLERYCRAFILQCGICASTDASTTTTDIAATAAAVANSKNDSAFVKDAIAAATEYLALERAGEKRLDIPPSLVEERFVSKLRAGQAKKSLNKLDLLTKLTNMVGDALDKVYQEQTLPAPAVGDLDFMFLTLTTTLSTTATASATSQAKSEDSGAGEDTSSAMEVEWDESADLTTTTNTNTERVIQAICTGLPLGDVRPNWTRSVSWWDDTCDRHLIIGSFKHGLGRYDLIRDDATLIFKSLVAFLPTNNDSAVVAEDDVLDANDAADNNDLELDDLPTTTNTATANASTWPDPRYLNRLATWLLTSELATMSKAEYQEKQRRDRKANKLQQQQQQQLQQFDGSPTRSTRLDGSSNGIGGIGGSGIVIAEKVSLVTLDESLFSSDEVTLLRRLLDRAMADYDSIAQAYKQQAMRKCEEVLAIDLPQDITTTTAAVEVKMELDQQGTSQDQENTTSTKTDTEDTTTTTATTASASASTIEEVKFTETIAVRLSATFILHGAPLQETSSDTDNNTTTNPSAAGDTYDWQTVRRYSGVTLTAKQIRGFYYMVWLPFCEKMTDGSPAELGFSDAGDCFIVPNPLEAVSEHHVAARGLCQIFALRQQQQYATHFVLTHSYGPLLDYLRSSGGRSVDNMPTWWCPWVHDIGLLLGIVRHGFLASLHIRLDDDLPFNPDYLEKFIRLAFIHNPEPSTYCSKIDFQTPQNAELFVQALLLQYPDTKDLEARLVRILDELTKDLPVDHFCRVVAAPQYRAILLHGDDGKAMSGKIDSIRSRGAARPPAMSLKAFTNTSRKRRKIYVAGNHPHCFGVTFTSPSKPSNSTSN